MKSSNRSGAFQTLLIIEALLVVSFFLAAALTALASGSDPDWVAASDGDVHVRSQLLTGPLRAHYRILNFFLHQSLTDPPADNGGAWPADQPLATLAALRQAEELIRQRRDGEFLKLISQAGSDIPFAQDRVRGLRLTYLYSRQRYAEFIQRFGEVTAPGDEMQLRRIRALLFLNRREEAFAAFRKMYSDRRIALFRTWLAPATVVSFLQRLDQDFWQQKLVAWRQQRAFSEMLAAANYIRPPQLAQLTRATAYYGMKKHAAAQKALAAIGDSPWRQEADTLQLKNSVFMQPAPQIAAQLDLLAASPRLNADLAYDLAGALFAQDDDERALRLIKHYLSAGDRREERYWRAAWNCAWQYYRRGQTGDAVELFRLGRESPLLSFRIANEYWYRKIASVPDLHSRHFPYTFYAVAASQAKAERELSSRYFTSLFSQPPSQKLLAMLPQLRELFKFQLWGECSEWIHWTLRAAELSEADRHILKLIEAVIYYRQGDFRSAYTSIIHFFPNYQRFHLPTFLSGLFFPVKYTAVVWRYSRQYGLDPYLLFALIREETFFRSDAVSRARAYGLMQLIWPTAQGLAAGQKIKLNVRQLFDPEINVRLGSQYFSNLLKKYDGKTHLALAAYNAGENAVKRWQNEFGHFPPNEFIEMIPYNETRNYVKNVLRNHFFYRYYYERNGFFKNVARTGDLL